MRVSIDLDLRCGSWYLVHAPQGGGDDDSAAAWRNCRVEKQDMMVKAEPRVLAFDIECTKEPLKYRPSLPLVPNVAMAFDEKGQKRGRCMILCAVVTHHCSSLRS